MRVKYNTSNFRFIPEVSHPCCRGKKPLGSYRKKEEEEKETNLLIISHLHIFPTTGSLTVDGSEVLCRFHRVGNDALQRGECGSIERG